MDGKPIPGDCAAEAVRRLSREPELRDRLAVFVDHWGMDSYDPAEVMKAVRQIVLCTLIDADVQAKVDGEPSR